RAARDSPRRAPAGRWKESAGPVGRSAARRPAGALPRTGDWNGCRPRGRSIFRLSRCAAFDQPPHGAVSVDEIAGADIRDLTRRGGRGARKVVGGVFTPVEGLDLTRGHRLIQETPHGEAEVRLALVLGAIQPVRGQPVAGDTLHLLG